MNTIDSCYGREREDRIIESFMIQDQMIDLEIDTGATVSVINENTYRQLKNSSVKEDTYDSENILGRENHPYGCDRCIGELPKSGARVTIVGNFWRTKSLG